MKIDLFFNNRNYMKSNPLRAVSQAFADTNDPGNEHKLAPGLSALGSSHPPPQATKAGKKRVRSQKYTRECLSDTVFPSGGTLKI